MVIVGIAINAKGGDCWIMFSLMPMVWLIDVKWLMIDFKWFMIDVIYMSLMKMIDVKWKPIDEDGSMSCHWYMMHSWCIWCSRELMQRWIIFVLSWLIRCTNGWTPKWSHYGEIPHRKTLYGLSYPRRMVWGPMLVCGIMRWRSMKLLVKLS